MSKLTTTAPIKRPKSITVILTAEASERLTVLAKKGKRSRQLEAMLRIHDSLKRVPEITGDYWEITTL
ncbi:TraY domain-containing protein [Enterobacter bugandensis]|uniref:TraY domain-containing protein n=1 Tax=Enterobacter bugandensis TaxID=881260 RepID=UPI002004438C|nr:TraY domain-containing protein [Enterobacter bugandensis]MCK7068935.1 TraY domain-containing protein [Enterobacter bugandensis]